ncbi:hypothetical protein MKW98_027185 [Papaver atlanticum]|uniref:Uncharacterized protein n=1 Tax=Papaver atlanticum TaxID=357466 RepID=A0AAD4XR53_9MAGN|nr:hypothetical protein MKW98_027185 [Papaver atlanticum]
MSPPFRHCTLPNNQVQAALPSPAPSQSPAQSSPVISEVPASPAPEIAVTPTISEQATTTAPDDVSSTAQSLQSDPSAEPQVQSTTQQQGHTMVTRAKAGITKPIQKLCLTATKHPPHVQVLTNGIEVKLQRNALSVIEPPTVLRKINGADTLESHVHLIDYNSTMS